MSGEREMGRKKNEMGRKKNGEVQLENPRTLDFKKVPVFRKRVVIPKKVAITKKTLVCKKEHKEDAIAIGENGKRQFFACYLLESTNPRYKNETYIGYTVNPRRRISQHNGEKMSGARKTRTKRPWKMVMCIHGFPTNVSALKFEWAWQHPLQSLAVRDAAASFTSLTGTASNVKLAYTMLTLREWKFMKLTVNFFSSVSTKFSAGCPNLPEKMKVQVCSMDDLPCYVENDSYEHVDDDMDDDEVGSVTSNYFDDYYTDIEAPCCDEDELLTEENGMLIESPVKKLDLRTSSSSLDEIANDSGVMADYTEKSDNGDSIRFIEEEERSVEPDHIVRKRSLSLIKIDDGKDKQAISFISTEDTANDWGFITEETVGDFINSIEEKSNVELGKFSMSQRSSSPITIDDDDDDPDGKDQPAVSFKADYITEEIDDKDIIRSIEDECKRPFSPITTDAGKYQPGVSFFSSTDEAAKDWGFFTDYTEEEIGKGDLINSNEEEENSIEVGHQIRKRSLPPIAIDDVEDQPAASSRTTREVEVIDVMTPSPDCRFSLWSKKRRVICPEIIDLTRSPAFVQL